MADGSGRAAVGISAIERAARILAASNGTGSFLRGNVKQLGAVPAESRGEVVGIAWRGQREESAARGIQGGARAAAMHAWGRSATTTALPSFHPDRDALAAMGRVEAVPGALLRVYALEAWSEWPVVEWAALVCVTGRGSREAVCDAMGRILWRVAAVSQDDRAKSIGMRASDYRLLTREAEALLMRWLDRGARQLLGALKGSGDPTHASGSDPCGFRRHGWWSANDSGRICPVRMACAEETSRTVLL